VGGDNASVTVLCVVLGTEQTGAYRLHTGPQALEPTLCFLGHELLKGTYLWVLAIGIA
jgi:hypothetical protein